MSDNEIFGPGTLGANASNLLTMAHFLWDRSTAGGRSPSAVEALQLSIEKYFRHYLNITGKRVSRQFIRSHSIVLLASKCDFPTTLEERECLLRTDAYILFIHSEKFNTEARFPDETYTERLFTLAESVRTFVLAKQEEVNQRDSTLQSEQPV